MTWQQYFCNPRLNRTCRATFPQKMHKAGDTIKVRESPAAFTAAVQVSHLSPWLNQPVPTRTRILSFYSNRHESADYLITFTLKSNLHLVWLVVLTCLFQLSLPPLNLRQLPRRSFSAECVFNLFFLLLFIYFQIPYTAGRGGVEKNPCSLRTRFWF